MIDDIINKSTPEPYRVLPSRAEYRLTLRQDNVFLRLLDKSKEIGILDKNKIEELESAKEVIENEIERLKEIIINPTLEIKEKLEKLGHDTVNNPPNAFEFLARKEMTYDGLARFIETEKLSKIVKEQVEINSKYKIFIDREKNQIEKFKKLEEMIIPKDTDYEKIKGIRNIAISGLVYSQPETIGQASRISGITHNDMTLLIVVIKEKNK